MNTLTSAPPVRFGLVHGMLDRPAVWQRLSPGLGERGSVVAPDFWWGSVASGNEQIDRVPTLEHFGPIRPDVIIAHSRGAYEVIREIGTGQPPQTALVLIGWCNQTVERSREVIPTGSDELLEMCRAFISDRARVDGVELSAPRREWMAKYAMGHFTEWDRNIHVSWPMLAEIDCPTLFIVGDQDQTMRISEVVRAASAMKEAQLAVIPDAGHWPMLEQPAAVLASITRFLDRLTRR